LPESPKLPIYFSVLRTALTILAIYRFDVQLRQGFIEHKGQTVARRKKPGSTFIQAKYNKREI